MAAGGPRRSSRSTFTGFLGSPAQHDLDVLGPEPEHVVEAVEDNLAASTPLATDLYSAAGGQISDKRSVLNTG